MANPWNQTNPVHKSQAIFNRESAAAPAAEKMRVLEEQRKLTERDEPSLHR